MSISMQDSLVHVHSLTQIVDGLATMQSKQGDMYQALSKRLDNVELACIRNVHAPAKEAEVAQMSKDIQSLQERVAKYEEHSLSALTNGAASHIMKDSGHADAAGQIVSIVPEAGAESGAETGAEKEISEVLADFQELEESIWDTSILIGLPETGIFGSVYIAALLCLNGFLQLALCLMINDFFTVPEITSEHLTGMRQWRVSYAHSTDLMNQFTYQSFGSSVCNSESGLMMVTEAAELFSEISAYLPLKADYESGDPVVGPILPHMEQIGVYMCLLAVVIWLMHIIASINTIHHKCFALQIIPLSSKSEIVYSEGSHTLISVTMARKIFCMLMLSVQFLVVALLGFAGILYIIRTLNMRDLLLNCSALAIVLDVDELFYAALVPHKAKHLLASMEALPRPLTRSLFGMTWSAVLAAILIVIVLICSMTLLDEQVVILEATRSEICGGNLNFVARADQAGIISATDVPVQEQVAETYDFKAMRQLVTEDAVEGFLSSEDMSAATHEVIGNPWSLIEWTSLDLNGVLDVWNDKCLDMFPISNGVHRGAPHFLQILHDVTKNSFIQDCLEAKQYCNMNNLKGVRTRTICPVTCGCSHPGSYLVLSGVNGCPPACDRTDLYNTSIWSRECEDLTLDSPYWSQLREGHRGFLSGYDGWNDDGVFDQIRAKGCGILSMPISIFGDAWTDPCEIHSTNLKPFTYACPVSCQCKASSRYLCPNTCDPSGDRRLHGQP